MHDMVGQSSLLCPFRRCQSAPIKCVSSITTGVPVLLSAIFPAAVIRGITRVVVDPTQTMPVSRSIPHIGVELLERIPRGADGDSSPAVIREGAISGIQASPSHAAPRTPFGGLSLTVRSAQVANDFYSATPAGLGTPRYQGMGLKRSDDSAVTANVPVSAAPSTLGIDAENGQALKPLSHREDGSVIFLGHRLSPSGGVIPPADLAIGAGVSCVNYITYSEGKGV